MQLPPGTHRGKEQRARRSVSHHPRRFYLLIFWMSHGYPGATLFFSLLGLPLCHPRGPSRQPFDPWTGFWDSFFVGLDTHRCGPFTTDTYTTGGPLSFVMIATLRCTTEEDASPAPRTTISPVRRAAPPVARLLCYKLLSCYYRGGLAYPARGGFVGKLLLFLLPRIEMSEEGSLHLRGVFVCARLEAQSTAGAIQIRFRYISAEYFYTETICYHLERCRQYKV